MKIPFAAVTLRVQPSLPTFEEPRCFVFGSEDAVRRVYDAAAFQPALDFGRVLLIAVHRGVARSGGYSIRIEGIEATEQAVQVRIRRTDPAAGAFVTMALTHPLAMVRVERADLPGKGPWTFDFLDEKGHVFANVHEQV
ncbi:MAG: protease complex subunit PrcB family protein [Symbiobacteriia bacterium]